MVRLDRTICALFITLVVIAASALAACHDIDEPPPLPPLDPRAPLDAGADAPAEDGATFGQAELRPKPRPDGPMT